MKKALMNFMNEESGAAMVEYGLALLVVAAIGVTSVTTIANLTGANVDNACTTVNNGTSC